MTRSVQELETYIDDQLQSNNSGNLTADILRTVLKELRKLRLTNVENATTSLTLDDSIHHNTVISQNNASPSSITLPNDLQVGFICSIYQKDSGLIAVSPATGATVINRLSHMGSAGVGSIITLTVIENVDDNSAVYVLTGDTA